MDDVENLLRKHNIYFRASAQDYITKCFNPDHEDSNPSFRIDKIKGVGHCFSCGFKVNIFKYYGVVPNYVNIKIAGLKEKLKIMQTNTNGLQMMEGSKPIKSKYRGISVETLNTFGAFTTDNSKEMEDRIVFPLYDVNNKLRVFVGRHTNSEAKNRYLNYPAGAKMELFPSKLKGNSKYLVLVEGMFDMLNLYDKGLTSVSAIMGTQTLTKETIGMKMLPFKAQGVTDVFLMMDADEAGTKAVNFLTPILEKLNFRVHDIQCEDGDPGDMELEEVQGALEYCQTTANADTTAITNKDNDNEDSSNRQSPVEE